MAETAIQKATSEIETVLRDCNAMALRQMPALTQAVVLATGVTQLRKALTDDIVKQVFMPLQGTPLGFVTDKDRDGGYGIAVIRDCMIEAMVNGLRPVNNEINIISGRMYAAKAGMQRLVLEFPGLTDLRMTPGVPQMIGDKGALVPIRATWRLHDKPMDLVRDITRDAAGNTVTDTRFAIRVNSGMGADAVIGKAQRKAFKAIYDMLTGAKWSVSEGDVIDTTGDAVPNEPAAAPVPPEQDGRRIKMGRNGSNQAPQEPAAASEPDRQPGEEG